MIKSSKIHILLIGNNNFINKIQKILNDNLLEQYIIEVITNEDDALKRLEHNSYDILILQDNFSKYNTLYLTQLAYAMSRPTIVICNSLIKKTYYQFWKYISNFSQTFTFYKKLIFFKHYKTNYLNLLIYLAKHHTQYLDNISKEIAQNTQL